MAEKAKVYIIVMCSEQQCVSHTYKLVHRLHEYGISTMVYYAKKPGKTLSRIKSQARLAIFIGKKEAATGRYSIKDLDTGKQIMAHNIDDALYAIITLLTEHANVDNTP